MKLLYALCIGVVLLGAAPVIGGTSTSGSSSTDSKMKDYEGSITENGKTFKDTCRATNLGEARQILKDRHPNGTVGAVYEVR